MRSSCTIDGSVSWSKLTVFGFLPLNSAAFLSVFLTLPQSQSEWVHFTGTCFHSHHGWCGKPFIYICAVCSLMSVCLWWHLRCSPSESDWEQGEPSMAEDSQTKLKLQQVNWMNNTSSLFSPHYVCFHSNIVRCQQMTKFKVLVLDPNFRQTWFWWIVAKHDQIICS